MIQESMGMAAVEFQKSPGPLQVKLTVRFSKMPRARCSDCGNRRVLYSIGIEDAIQSAGRCGKCAGIR